MVNIIILDRWFVNNYFRLKIFGKRKFVISTKHFDLYVFAYDVDEWGIWDIKIWFEYFNNVLVILACRTYRYKYINACRLSVHTKSDPQYDFYDVDILFTHNTTIIQRIIKYTLNILTKIDRRQWNDFMRLTYYLLQNFLYRTRRI